MKRTFLLLTPFFAIIFNACLLNSPKRSALPALDAPTLAELEDFIARQLSGGLGVEFEKGESDSRASDFHFAESCLRVSKANGVLITGLKIHGLDWARVTTLLNSGRTAIGPAAFETHGEVITALVEKHARCSEWASSGK